MVKNQQGYINSRKFVAKGKMLMSVLSVICKSVPIMISIKKNTMLAIQSSYKKKQNNSKSNYRLS